MLEVPDFNEETGNFIWNKFVEKQKDVNKKDEVNKKVEKKVD